MRIGRTRNGSFEKGRAQIKKGCDSAMIDIKEIEKMSREEKLQTMEAIWTDLSKNETEVESPAWHAEVLKKTEARVDAGEEKIADWESAKRELRRRFE
jgi:hypothetical protein